MKNMIEKDMTGKIALRSVHESIARCGNRLRYLSTLPHVMTALTDDDDNKTTSNNRGIHTAMMRAWGHSMGQLTMTSRALPVHAWASEKRSLGGRGGGLAAESHATSRAARGSLLPPMRV